MKLNQTGYEKLIEGDLEWLNDQKPSTLESRHIADVLKWSVKALYPLEDSVRKLIDALPQCDLRCTEPATRAYGRGGARYCDTHAPSDCPEYPRAAPLRVLFELLKEGSRR